MVDISMNHIRSVAVLLRRHPATDAIEPLGTALPVVLEVKLANLFTVNAEDRHEAGIEGAGIDCCGEFEQSFGGTAPTSRGDWPPLVSISNVASEAGFHAGLHLLRQPDHVAA